MRYEPRWYRATMGEWRFRSFTVTVGESDLWIGVDPASYRGSMTTFVYETVSRLRADMVGWAHQNPSFLTALTPVPAAPEAPAVVRAMIAAGEAAGVGPMAAVAGAIAERVGRRLREHYGCRSVVVENGGDIWASAEEPILFRVYAGTSPLSERVAIEIAPSQMPLGVCTSAGTVGHSLSFGRADAALVAMPDAAMADAFATAFGNRLSCAADIEPQLAVAQSIPHLVAALFIVGDRLGVWGAVRLVPCEKNE